MNVMAAASTPPSAGGNPLIVGRLLRVEPSIVQPGGALKHFCPACRMLHAFSVNLPDDEGRLWRWDGNGDRPTFTPDMDVWPPGEWTPRVGLPDAVIEELRKFRGNGRCHYRLTDGVIAFFADCTHALAGKTTRLPALPGYLW